eukprot:682813-Hanusia_phi.AAC.2
MMIKSGGRLVVAVLLPATPSPRLVLLRHCSTSHLGPSLLLGWDGRAAFAELRLSIAVTACFLSEFTVLLSFQRQFESFRTSPIVPEPRQQCHAAGYSAQPNAAKPPR